MQLPACSSGADLCAQIWWAGKWLAAGQTLPQAEGDGSTRPGKGDGVPEGGLLRDPSAQDGGIGARQPRGSSALVWSG